ncbi:MAG: OsmC family peroxiredoxin [Gemmatimonadetes bacterium]|nr:OsmC family protein [Gemmatimonadota bacterium]NIQ56454.1 OsmC family protein [Gemmatimonadota bacterium]NIU76643.1 OsmC family peroxiredoxin [Gammaproteobacteria bacterium]NIX46083.1 OsmC family peroxiredoxin [Gemmatimonadota bacterium]NIY10406.1 OsmC family peroxiredoxin [Gemmatimonadota bacterium]
MSDVAVTVRWEDGMRFEAVGRGGVPVPVDGDAEAGPSPMESLLISLAACMGADVVDLLGKMRVSFDGLAVHVEGDRRSELPRRYTAVRLTYETRGVPATEGAKLQRAIDLSRDKYCSVLHTLHPDLDVSIRVETG